MNRWLWIVVSLVWVAGCGELTIETGDEPWDVDSSQDRANNAAPPANNTNTTPPNSTNNSTNTGTNNQTNNDIDPEPEPEPMCTVPEKMCADACVDVTNSDAHCGDCNQACPGESMCMGATCACGNGDELCGAACVNTAVSNQHCGSCNMACAGGQLCVASACVENTNVLAVLQATNAARAAGADCGAYGIKEPVPALAGDVNLHLAAQVHSDDMADNNFFSHTGSDNSNFSTRIGRTAFSGQPLGENIAGGGSGGAGVVDRWIASDGHCRNLMNPSATKIGIGYTGGGPYGTSWVQVFGR